MRVLLDQGTPAPLRRYLLNHDVSTALQLRWSTLTNGELLEQAEAAGFDVLITTDQNLRYQQNLSKRRISILVICTTSWLRIEKQVRAVTEALERVSPGGYTEIQVP
ncbi:MAG TPA: hypothetical protein VHY79_08235 [Rhizomicrobium sp.]|nr:hypothetical protein [Rhizomicrobium sp.]